MSGRLYFNRNGNKAGASEPTLEERQLTVMVRRAHERGITAPPLVTCDPQCDDEKKLDRYLAAEVEPELRYQAAAAMANGQEFKFIVGLVDKAQQNAINKLAGEQGGNAAMEAYWEVGGAATADVAAMNGSQNIGLYLARVAPKSDEGVNVIGGIKLIQDTGRQFKAAWDYERAALDLSRFKYTVEVPVGGRMEAVELDLRGFSRILRNPGMVVACNFKISRPIALRPDERQGFIQDQIRELENSEVEFFPRLPRVYSGNGGLTEVRTPFGTSLERMGRASMEHGTVIEIKLNMPEELAEGFRPFIADKRDSEGTLLEAGTRKCHAEVNSRRAGMRFFNTFFGKSRSNEILTPITRAMDDLRAAGIEVIPISGGYLHYWVGAPSNDATVRMVESALASRINSGYVSEDYGRIDMEFTPSAMAVDASTADLRNIRALLTLKSMGKENYPVEALARVDFLVNFLNQVNPDIQKEILAPFDCKEMAGMVRRVCSERRTIRDSEDLVWTLRGDNKLPAEIDASRERLEAWVFDFAMEAYNKIFHRLVTTIQSEMRSK